jgi:hypothetical protein
LKIGMIGTVTNPTNGREWDGEFYVESLGTAETDPRKEQLTVASVRRLITRTPRPGIERDPARQPQPTDHIEVRLDQPDERCEGLAARWFTPADPPRFFTPPATTAEAVTA